MYTRTPSEQTNQTKPKPYLGGTFPSPPPLLAMHGPIQHGVACLLLQTASCHPANLAFSLQSLRKLAVRPAPSLLTNSQCLRSSLKGSYE